MATIAVVAGSVVVAAAASVIVWRAPLAEAAIRVWLEGTGFADPSLSVTRIGPEAIEIERLRARRDQPLEIGRLRVTYTLADLLAGRMHTVEASDTRLPVTVTAGGVSIAGIPVGGGGASASVDARLPFASLRLEDATLDAETPAGPATVVLDGVARQHEGEDLSAAFEIALRGDGFTLGGSLRAEGTSLRDLSAALTVTRGSAGFASARLDALQGTGEMAIRHGALARAGLVLTAGSTELPASSGPLRGSLRLRLDYSPPSAALDAVFHEASGDASYRMSLDDGTVSAGDGALAAEAVLRAAADRLSLPGVDGRGLRLEAPIRLRLAGRRITVALPAGGSIQAEAVELPGSARTSQPVRIEIAPADFPVLSLAFGGGSAVARIDALHAGALSLAVPRDGEAPIPVEARGLRLGLSGGAGGPGGGHLSGDLSAGSVALPDQAITLGELAVDFAMGGEDPALTAALHIGSISHGSRPPLFAPLVADGTIEGPLDGLAVAATLRDGASGALRGRLEGKWSPDTPGNGLVAAFGPFTFAPDGLQPADLSPRLRALESATGRVSGRVRINPTGKGPGLTGELAVEALSFAIAGTRVQEMATRMAFTDFAGPSTAPRQVLTVAHISLPTSLDDLRAVYQLKQGPAGRPVLRIDSARAAVLGGTLSLSDAALDLAGAAQELPFSVEGMDLGKLLALADLEGVDGTGTLDGTVPISLSAESVAIRGARLESAGGILHIHSDAAAELLAAQGQQVDLALRALEDFHYSELSITIDKPAEGKASLALSTLGHNPAVLDGHPFRFNVTLTSNVDELVDALLRGYRIATEAAGLRPGRP